jgi:hypothetical protein
MRKFVYSILDVALGTSAVASGVAIADSANTALHIRGTECEVSDGNGNAQWVPYHEVLNNNHGELICSGQVPNGTGARVHYDSNSAGVQHECAAGTLSTSWDETVSASGRATVKVICLSNR